MTDTFRIHHDDSPYDIIDNINKLIRRNGIKIVNFEGEDGNHDGYDTFIIKPLDHLEHLMAINECLL